MLQKISSVFVVYRHKTLTGSPDPTHAIGTDKPCMEMHLPYEDNPFLPHGRFYLPLLSHAIEVPYVILPEGKVSFPSSYTFVY